MKIREMHLDHPVPFKWLEITGLDKEGLQKLGRELNIDESIIKTCLSNTPLPRIEEYTNLTFIVLRTVDKSSVQQSDSLQKITNKISVLFNDEFILILTRNKDTSYQYFNKLVPLEDYRSFTPFTIAKNLCIECMRTFENLALEYIEEVEKIEDLTFLKEHDRAHLKNLYYLKRKIDVIKRTTSYFNEIVEFFRINSKRKNSMIEMRDLYVRIKEQYSNLFDNISQLINIYFNISSYHTNEIMRVLTVFSVFFLPITFIVGVYGMNFKNMPELEWYYGYPVCITIMIIITIGIYKWFKKRRWL